MTNACAKLNTGFIMRPYAFFGSKKNGRQPRTESIFAGEVYSMTRKQESCTIGYARLMEKFNCSKSTISRAVKRAREKGVISVNRRGGKTNEYTYTGNVEKRAHVRTENFFYTEIFVINGIKRPMTNAEVDFFSLVYTDTNDKKKGKYEGSNAKTAEILNMSEKTVERATHALLSLGLIFRPEKGVNGHKGSVYVANMKWIRERQKSLKKEEKKTAQQAEKSPFVSKEVLAADARTDREKFYSERQDRAQRLADSFLKKANQEPRYPIIAAELRKMELALGKAEVYNPKELPALEERKRSLEAEKASILDRLGIEEWQLEAENHVICKKCSDTGFLPNGAGCDCYRLRI